MATGRMLRPTISTDASVNGMGDFAQLLFTWMISHADDYGCLTGNPAQVWALVIPFKRDKSFDDVAKALTEMVNAKLIWWYEVGGRQYIQFCKWETNQSGLHKRTTPKQPLYKKPAATCTDAHDIVDVSEKFPEVPGISPRTEQNGTEEKRSEQEQNAVVSDTDADQASDYRQEPLKQGTDATTSAAIRFAFSAGTTRPTDIERLSEFLSAGMAPEAIEFAIEKMRGKPGARFGYVNTILETWLEKGILTRLQAESEWKGDKPRGVSRGYPAEIGDISELVVKAR